MAELNIDFEGTGGNDGQGQAGNGNQTIEGGATKTTEDVTPLNGGDVDDLSKKTTSANEGTTEPDNNGNGEDGDDDDNSSTGELEAGTQVEYENATYTVAENGDLVDKDGKVFKQASEVKDWIKSLEQEPDRT